MVRQTIAVVATFTAESVKDCLAFWMQELAIPAAIEFAPYGQVFQQLLDPGSLLAQNQDGINIVLLRIDDWLQSGDEIDSQRNSPGADDRFLAQMTRSSQDFVVALRTAAERSKTPYLVCMCPASPATLANPRRSAALRQLEEQILRDVQRIPGAYAIGSTDLTALYPVDQYHDPHGEELGHVPYTAAFFVAMGTTIARKIHSLRSPAYKVIVLDCDQTLWRGVCGEDGVLGVEIDPPRRRCRSSCSDSTRPADCSACAAETTRTTSSRSSMPEATCGCVANTSRPGD